MEIINTGLIGFGVGGQTFHAPLISCIPGLHLAKIRASKEAHIVVAAARYPQAEIVANADDIFNDPAIDLVVISTPNTLHYSLAMKALNAGKHVVLDKPFTINTEEADDLIPLAMERNKILTVYHNRRLDGDFLTVQKIIQSELLGELVEFESHYDRFRNYLRPGAWREEDVPGSGILYDLGSHLIDQALVLFGLPDAVSADLRVQRKEAKVTDNFDVVLHYSRLKVTLKAGMLVREAPPRFMLYGDQGSFIKYGMDVQEEALKAGQRPHNNSNWGIEPPANWGKINTVYKDMRLHASIETEPGNYAAFYQNIYDAITGSGELQVKAGQARNTIRIIELALLSNSEKRTVAFSYK